MRSILVHGDAGPAMRTRLDAALSLARATGGHVSVLVDTPIARFATVDPIGGSFIAAGAISDSLDRDDAVAARLEARLASQEVPGNVIRCEEEPVVALAEAARLADVVVLSRHCDFAGALALATRCPILLVPGGKDDPGEDHPGQPAGRPWFPIGRACIGWDGGDDAAAALRAAVPLLAGAEVHVVTAPGGHGGCPAAAALRYLSRHGIAAQAVEGDRAGSAEESLAATAARLNADLLVLGAYGHSRIHELLFGSVARYFIRNETGPLLLIAH